MINYKEQFKVLEDMVGELLADESEITPAELRQCFSAYSTFLKKISPLAEGVFQIGDTGTDELRVVNLPYDVGISDYRVTGSLVSHGSDFNKDNDVFEMVREKTATSFKLCLREVSGGIQNLTLEWAIYPKN